jgi:hypothetical protein
MPIPCGIESLTSKIHEITAVPGCHPLAIRHQWTATEIDNERQSGVSPCAMDEPSIGFARASPTVAASCCPTEQ